MRKIWLSDRHYVFLHYLGAHKGEKIAAKANELLRNANVEVIMKQLEWKGHAEEICRVSDITPSLPILPVFLFASLAHSLLTHSLARSFTCTSRTDGRLYGNRCASGTGRRRDVPRVRQRFNEAHGRWWRCYHGAHSYDSRRHRCAFLLCHHFPPFHPSFPFFPSFPSFLPSVSVIVPLLTCTHYLPSSCFSGNSFALELQGGTKVTRAVKHILRYEHSTTILFSTTFVVLNQKFTVDLPLLHHHR